MGAKTTKVRNVVLLVVFSLLTSFAPGIFVFLVMMWPYAGLAELLPNTLPQVGYPIDPVQVVFGIWAGQLIAYITVGNPLDKWIPNEP